MSDNADDELMKQVAKGDSKAFEKLFVKYKTAVFGMSMRFMGQKNLAEEIAQETWIRVVRSAPQYEPQGYFKTWLLTITKNLSLNELEKRGWEELQSNTEDGNSAALEVIDKADSALELLQKNTDLTLLKHAISRLSDKQRACLTLWIYHEKSLQEVAQDLKTTEAAVKVLIHRAKEKLLVLCNPDKMVPADLAQAESGEGAVALTHKKEET